MERSTAGRRHARAGSVTVADLVGRQSTTARVLQRDEAVSRARSPQVDDLYLLAYPPVKAPPSNATSRFVRYAGCTVGALALCGSVAAGSLITGHTPPANIGDRMARPSAITGAAALRPDLLHAQLNGPVPTNAPGTQPQDTVSLASVTPTPTTPTTTSETMASSASSASSAPSATTTTVEQGQQPAVDAGIPNTTLASSSEQPVTTDPRVPAPVENIEVVRQFYRLIGSSPAAASTLVDPGLLGSDLSGFIGSWSAVRSVTVDRTEARPDRSVLAIVSLRLSDGGRLVVEQLLRTSKTAPHRITSVEIRSAQRS